MKFHCTARGVWCSVEGYALLLGKALWFVRYPDRFFSRRSYTSKAAAWKHAQRHHKEVTRMKKY